MRATRKDLSHLPQYRAEDRTRYQIEFGEETYTVFCKGVEVWSGDIREMGFRKGDSRRTQALKIARVIASYLLRRH